MDAETLAQVEHIVTSVVGTALTSLSQELATAITGLRQEIVDSRHETMRHTGILFEDVQHKLDLIIEGMQFLRQADADIRTEIAHESRETRALLRLSYEQLDQRVHTLEQRLGPPN
jgi:hypothetical protein